MKFAILAVLLVSRVAAAHKPSDAHLQIVVADDRLSGSLAVAIRDLDGALELDFDGNGQITWAEAHAAGPRIAAYAAERLAITGDGSPCSITFGAPALVDFSDGAYWTLPITGTCPSPPEMLAVTYELLFDIDAQHRGIVQIRSAGTSKTAVARDASPIIVQLEPSSAGTFFRRGFGRVTHSLEQLVFLACLVLPIVLRPKRRESAREVVCGTATLFGAFALANATMLLVSAAGLVQVPAILVEIAIALSVVAVAVMNLARVLEARWDLAFELGLLHGLGFAIWLHDLGVPAHRLAPVLGFGAGVVVAQAAVVAVLVAGLFVLRRTVGYQVLLWAGSATAVGAGAIWALLRCL